MILNNLFNRRKDLDDEVLELIPGTTEYKLKSMSEVMRKIKSTECPVSISIICYLLLLFICGIRFVWIPIELVELFSIVSMVTLFVETVRLPYLDR